MPALILSPTNVWPQGKHCQTEQLQHVEVLMSDRVGHMCNHDSWGSYWRNKSIMLRLDTTLSLE